MYVWTGKSYNDVPKNMANQWNRAEGGGRGGGEAHTLCNNSGKSVLKEPAGYETSMS